MTALIELTCRDPVVSRDGRPFGAGQGNRMRSAGWLLPSVVAGALRTVVGTAAGRDFSVATAQELLQVAVAGAFPVAEGQLYLPVPQDCVVRNTAPLRAAPQTLDDGGGDWPAEGLRPVMLTEEQAPDDFKPEQAPAWWPCDRYSQWLAGNDISFDHRFLNALPDELRTHVKLDAHAGAAEEGMLFTTAALPLTHLARYGAAAHDGFRSRLAEISLCVRVRASQWCADTVATLDNLHPLGGERRLVHWKASQPLEWRCPDTLRAVLVKTQRARMVLATPGIFRDGWKPGWLNSQLIGRPPGSNTTLKLVGVSIQRWRAVSGWSLASLPGQPRGPKPVRRVVPAGGVYFFETVDATTNDLDARWLEPVSDDEQDQRDGFGLAVWGTW
jgi:CRISPR-associated protein Cmr3